MARTAAANGVRTEPGLTAARIGVAIVAAVNVFDRSDIRQRNNCHEVDAAIRSRRVRDKGRACVGPLLYGTLRNYDREGRPEAKRISVPKAYWIATYRSIRDPQAIAEYAKLAGPAIWSAGGRNIVRGTPAKTLEEGLDLRTVVIEFDSVASALAAYESPAYQSARKILGDAAVRDIRIVESVEE
jgi:uncharacterized protein (DUF1330 family)